MAQTLDVGSKFQSPVIALERQDHILRLRLNNPPANAFSVELMELLQTELLAAGDDRSLRVVVIAAAGKLFSAGHDLKELSSHRRDRDAGRAFFEHTFKLCSALMQLIATFPKPVIAEVDGIATAAGCQLIASCDLVVASDRSKFGVNGIDVGLFCTSPAVALTRVISRKRAMEMLLTGEMIDASTAREFGLVNRVVERASLAETVTKLAQTIAAKSPVAIRLGKQAVLRQSAMDLSQAYEHASGVMVENLMARDAEEGIDAFLKGRGG